MKSLLRLDQRLLLPKPKRCDDLFWLFTCCPIDDSAVYCPGPGTLREPLALLACPSSLLSKCARLLNLWLGLVWLREDDCAPMDDGRS